LSLCSENDLHQDKGSGILFFFDAIDMNQETTELSRSVMFSFAISHSYFFPAKRETYVRQKLTKHKQKRVTTAKVVTLDSLISLRINDVVTSSFLLLAYPSGTAELLPQ